MKINSTRLSIIIPTKNRYSTLFHVVKSILNNVKGSNYEVVIQDNSDCNKDALLFIHQQGDDERIKYFYNNEVMPISDNTELAIKNSSGTYICFIGDDDFVSPQICEITNVLYNKDISCLIYNPGYYWWDSVKFYKENYYHQPKNLWLPDKMSKDLVLLNSNEELNKTLKKGAVSYYSLPRLYHGIVKREVLDKIRDKTGVYLTGSCPDIAFAVSLSLVIEKYYYMDFPVTIFGASKNSGGGWTASKKHYGTLGEITFLRPNIQDVWDFNIPKIWSQTTIYPQTTSEVLKVFDFHQKINYISFYATMLVNEPYLFSLLYKSIFNYCRFNPIKYLMLFLKIFKKLMGLLLRSIKIKTHNLGYDVHQKVEVNQLSKFFPKY